MHDGWLWSGAQASQSGAACRVCRHRAPTFARCRACCAGPGYGSTGLLRWPLAVTTAAPFQPSTTGLVTTGSNSNGWYQVGGVAGGHLLVRWCGLLDYHLAVPQHGR